MKEYPISMNTEMVKAVLEGKKTQTRRLLDPQPLGLPEETYCTPYNHNPEHFTFWTKDKKMCLPIGNVKIKGKETVHWRCKYGQVGDLLWVRETWAKSGLNRIEYKAFPADGEHFRSVNKWKPSIHMFRKDSRITLEITDVRLEKIRDITIEDAIAEGIEREYAQGKELGWKNYLWHGHFGRYGMGNKESDRWKYQYSTYGENPVDSFSSLWNSIHKKEDKWQENPFVWVITFRRIKP